MQKEIKFITYSKKGIQRQRNQDRIQILENDKYILFSVFDGVSSYDDSYLFIESFKKEIRIIYKKLLNSKGEGLQELFYHTNKKISSLGFNGKSAVSILFISKLDNIVKYISLGDTRIYIHTDQFLEKITTDDSLVNSNMLTRYLGLEDLTIDDFKASTIEGKYNFLICTDGFYSLMQKNLMEYFQAINFRYFANVKRKLALLQRNKNSDDSTYIIIRNEIL